MRDCDFDIPPNCYAGSEFRAVKHPLTNAPDKWKYDVRQCLILQRATKIPSLPQEWLWPNRIPHATLTLLAGDPGLGKSLLTVELAMRLSRGLPWPDRPEVPNEPTDVFLISGEDHYQRTIRPRLEQAGADLSQIQFVKGVANFCQVGLKRWQTPFTIPDDLPGLRREIATGCNRAVVIIDPISAVLRKGSSSDMAMVRQLLRPLEECAIDANAAIICVHHLNKTDSSSGIYRVMGSLGFTAAARAVWGVARDADDRKRRLFLPVKINLAEDPPGLAFRIVDGRIEWEAEPVDLTWDDALDHRPKSQHPSPALERAARWLTEQLLEQDVPYRELRRRAAQAGITEITLERARAATGFRSYRVGFGKGGNWLWGTGTRPVPPRPHKP